MINKESALQDFIKAVSQFHDSFKISNAEEMTAELSKRDYELRFNLLKEENEEYLEACKNGDMIEIADALGDLLYIWCGTVLKHGLEDKIGEVFAEIQASNMSKLDANGEPIYREDGKVLKGENYFKPNIKKVLYENA